MERIIGSVLLEPPKEPVFRVPNDHSTASTATLRPRTELACINSCDLDKHLKFQSDGHVYFFKDAKVGCSAAKQH